MEPSSLNLVSRTSAAVSYQHISPFSVSVNPRPESLPYQLSAPESNIDYRQLTQIAKTHAELEIVVKAYDGWRKAQIDYHHTQQLIDEYDKDPVLQQLASLEITKINEHILFLEEHLKVLLLPKDTHDEKNVFLEIQGGIGNEETIFWVEDLMRMYCKYAKNKRWQVFLLHKSRNGVILKIQGDRVYGQLKFETGIHEAQCIQWRHDSQKLETLTATVTVMPEVDESEFNVDPQDLELTVLVRRRDFPSNIRAGLWQSIVEN
jgi:peptide chain release factor 1